jgi:hypothetical protein
MTMTKNSEQCLDKFSNVVNFQSVAQVIPTQHPPVGTTVCVHVHGRTTVCIVTESFELSRPEPK